MERGRDGDCGREMRLPASRNEAREELIIEKEERQNEDEVVKESVVGGKDDAELPGRDDEETNDAEAARQEKHPNED